MRTASVILTALVFAFAPTVIAETATFHIPFPFIAYDSEFPAGDYELVQVTGSGFVNLYSRETLRGYRLPAFGQNQLRQAGPARLTFERHGDVCVLRRYYSSGQGITHALPLSQRRKALVRSYLARGLDPERILVAAK